MINCLSFLRRLTIFSLLFTIEIFPNNKDDHQVIYDVAPTSMNLSQIVILTHHYVPTTTSTFTDAHNLYAILLSFMPSLSQSEHLIFLAGISNMNLLKQSFGIKTCKPNLKA